MNERTDRTRPPTEEARDLAQRLLAEARHGALGVIDPENASPLVTRVAVSWNGTEVLILVSDLSTHTRALLNNPAASLLVGEPGAKGDPLSHPRLSVLAQAKPIEKAAERAGWLAKHPKSKLYFDFADFRLFGLLPSAALLNGGFGEAFRLSPDDLRARLDTPGR